MQKYRLIVLLFMNTHPIQVTGQGRNLLAKPHGNNKLFLEALSQPQSAGDISSIFINSNIVTVVCPKEGWRSHKSLILNGYS